MIEDKVNWNENFNDLISGYLCVDLKIEYFIFTSEYE